MLVVRVTCSSCGKPLGVAIVGTGAQPTHSRADQPPEWTRRDAEKFANRPAISYDDVLSAHEFFDGLGADWSRQLPRIGRAAH